MKIKYTVIGAGVVGLAIAKTISDVMAPGENLLVVEKEDSFGRGISSRNSEVIHSGIYYPQGSLKHLLCVNGRKKLYEYCQSRGVEFSKCGKMIVAVDDNEIEDLEKVYNQAQKNVIENIAVIDKKQALELEPDINVYRALLCGETGIIDSHGLMKALINDITDNDGMIVYKSEVTSIQRHDNVYSITLDGGTSFITEYVINSAGLKASSLSDMAGIATEKMYPCKGTYFCYTGRHSLKHLLYPIPHKNLTGLGVHATLDLNGRLRFGPDAEYVTVDDDFSVDEGKKDAFYTAAKKLIKNLDYDKFNGDTVGIRPKIQGPDDGIVKDFYINNEIEKGFPRFINLIGIESPGLTSSLAIGEYVFSLLRKIN